MLENNATFVELMENKEFVHEMMSQETPEDVQKIFADNGVDMTIDEVNEIGRALANAENGALSNELSEEALEDVSGGVVITAAGVWAAVRIIGAVGSTALAAYKWYKSR